MKVKLLVDDLASFNRFKKGDLGTLLNNDLYEKYDYFVEIDKHTTNDLHIRMYFYKDEVEMIEYEK